MTEEYFEQEEMERDLGIVVEPYTGEEIDQMYETLKPLKKAVYNPETR